MSLFHYIGSEVPLPLGARGGRRSSLDRCTTEQPTAIRFLTYELPEGSQPLYEVMDMSWVKEEETAVYDTVEDAAGIYIMELEDKRRTAIQKHIKLPYIYGVGANYGNFRLSQELKENYPQDYRAHRKCITTLFELMQEVGGSSATFELYSCWYDQEKLDRIEELTRYNELSSYQIEGDFELLDRQYYWISK